MNRDHAASQVILVPELERLAAKAAWMSGISLSGADTPVMMQLDPKILWEIIEAKLSRHIDNLGS